MYDSKTKLMIVGVIIVLLVAAALIFWFREKLFNFSGSFSSLNKLTSKKTTDETTTDVIPKN